MHVYLLPSVSLFASSFLIRYLQELLSVQLCSRKLGLFLAVVQFTGYTFLAYLLRTYVYRKESRRVLKQTASSVSSASLSSLVQSGNSVNNTPTNSSSMNSVAAKLVVPLSVYLGLSLLRAVDLACTNLAMQFINYPAKTLIKSSRIVFTMIFGVFITHKKYNLTDYSIVMCMVVGLVVFMHADATSSAVFQPLGVILLVSFFVRCGKLIDRFICMISVCLLGFS
jgi:UAA transporter family